VLDFSSLLFFFIFIARLFIREKIFIPRRPFITSVVVIVIVIVLGLDGESCIVPLFRLLLPFFPPIAIPIVLSLRLVFFFTLINAMPPFFPRPFFFVFFHIMPPLPPFFVFTSF
jgi:hypothetical protein